MLQQTQVPRVLPKFVEFTRQFPAIDVLARASLGDVLAAWSGLGYNRRAKYLWETAKKVVKDQNGALPRTSRQLVQLPGIGPNTAGAIMAYAYNQPVVFVETNIRTVMIHHFFGDQPTVTDAQIVSLVEQTLDRHHSREWYWALMDYGTHLKSQIGSQLARVHGYRQQSRFEGSRRQIRGHVLRLLMHGKRLTHSDLTAIITDSRLPDVLAMLEYDGLIHQTNGAWHLT